LILLYLQNVVRFGVNNLLRGFLLTVHRISCDDGTFQIQNFQQFLYGGNLVRFLRHADLAKAKAHVIGPNVDHMQRLQRGRLVMRTSQRLAINRHGLTV